MHTKLKSLILLVLLLTLVLSVSSVASARSTAEIKRELDAAHRQLMAALESGKDVEALFVRHNALLDEFAASTVKTTPALPEDSGRSAAPVLTPAMEKRLRSALSMIQNIDPSVTEPVPSPGLLKSFFAKVRGLFGASSEEDLYIKGRNALEDGNFQEAQSIFSKLEQRNPQSLKYRYFHAQSLLSVGDAAGADFVLNGLQQEVATQNFQSALNAITDPYVNERVAFKIGGFDSIDQYRNKVLAGNPIELHSDVYFEKYVNPKTWDWYSASAKKEFESIGGIDCGGLCQQVYMQLCQKAGLKAPFNSKLPGAQLKNAKYSKRLNEDGGIPPKTAKPGDIMHLSKHDGWGHVFMFDGWNDQGKPMIVEASGEGYCMRRPMPDRYYARYDGTYRWNQMDEIQKRLGDGA